MDQQISVGQLQRLAAAVSTELVNHYSLVTTTKQHMPLREAAGCVIAGVQAGVAGRLLRVPTRRCAGCVAASLLVSSLGAIVVELYQTSRSVLANTGGALLLMPSRWAASCVAAEVLVGAPSASIIELYWTRRLLLADTAGALVLMPLRWTAGCVAAGVLDGALSASSSCIGPAGHCWPLQLARCCWCLLGELLAT